MMFQDAAGVVVQISGKIGLIKNQRDNRRVRIANFFEKIGTCLEKITEALDDNQSFDNHIDEIEVYLDAFSSAVGDIIGFELTDRLEKSLRTAFDQKNFKNLLSLSVDELSTEKKNLKEVSGQFIDLWLKLQ